jgi:hypothetical protein
MKALTLAILLALFARHAPAKMLAQDAQIGAPSEEDLTDTLDYSLWLLRLQYGIDHARSGYAEEEFKELRLSPADETALRAIVADFTKQHDKLMAQHYAKIDNNQWTPEAETQLIKNLVAATNDTIQQIHAKLTADGAKRIDNVVLRNDEDSVFEH